MVENRIRILIVDDHTVVRRGVAILLAAYADIEVVGEACDGFTAIDLARELQPDVILMDVIMPGISGIEATGIICRELPQVHVIGLSMHDEIEVANEMRKSGAAGLLSKTESPEIVVEFIRKCVAEQKSTFSM